jgi:hypothetical protein
VPAATLRDGIVRETTGLYARHGEPVPALQIPAVSGLAVPLRVFCKSTMAATALPHVDVSLSAATHRWPIRATPATLCRIILWSFLVVLVTTTSADPDLWGHLRFGLDMLASKSIVVADPYSFTADRPWINHEWLAELLMGMGFAGFGALGLNLLKLTFIAVVGAIALVIAKQEQASPIARDLYAALTVFATYSRTQVVRPQLFSVAIFSAVLLLLRETDRDRPQVLWYVPLLFAAWVNLHGGWIVGLAALGVWMLGDACQHRTLRWTVRLMAIGTLALLATLLNPYGLGLWRFMAETVGPDRSDVTDWKPLLQLPPGILVIESILPLIAIAATWRKRWWRRVPVRDMAVLVLLAGATFRIGRVDAFLQASIAVFLARPIIALLNDTALKVRGLFQRTSMPVGVMGLALASYVVLTGVSRLRVIDVAGSWIPDRAAATFLREYRPGARVLTWFDWGEYALWQLSPSGIRVSMDGRRETVYSAAVIHDHERFYRGDVDMLDYPERIGANHVWLPSHLPIIEPLRQRGWVTMFDTGRSVILGRGSAPFIAHVAAPSGGRDIFPWP